MDKPAMASGVHRLCLKGGEYTEASVSNASTPWLRVLCVCMRMSTKGVPKKKWGAANLHSSAQSVSCALMVAERALSMWGVMPMSLMVTQQVTLAISSCAPTTDQMQSTALLRSSSWLCESLVSAVSSTSHRAERHSREISTSSATGFFDTERLCTVQRTRDSAVEQGQVGCVCASKQRRIAWARVSEENAGAVHLDTSETACSEHSALTQSVLLRTAVQRTVSRAVVALHVSADGASTKRFRCWTSTRSGKYGRSMCCSDVAAIDGCTRMAMSCVCAVSSLFCFTALVIYEG